jgi:hypothetical protein
MTRDELIKLGRKIVNCEGTEEEVDNMIDLFDKNVPHPNGANLFFYPENYNARKNDLSKYNPTVEEVVDKCLSYKSIEL